MIHDFSHRDRSIVRIINKTVGNPFGLMQRLKLKGVGSARFILKSASAEIMQRLPKEDSILHLSLELRPKGVIVHFKKYTEHYTWVIPYYRLTLYYSDSFSIHGEGEFIKVAANTLTTKHHQFLRKLIDLKTSYQAQFKQL